MRLNYKWWKLIFSGDLITSLVYTGAGKKCPPFALTTQKWAFFSSRSASAEPNTQRQWRRCRSPKSRWTKAALWRTPRSAKYPCFKQVEAFKTALCHLEGRRESRSVISTFQCPSCHLDGVFTNISTQRAATCALPVWESPRGLSAAEKCCAGPWWILHVLWVAPLHLQLQSYRVGIASDNELFKTANWKHLKWVSWAEIRYHWRDLRRDVALLRSLWRSWYPVCCHRPPCPPQPLCWLFLADPLKHKTANTLRVQKSVKLEKTVIEMTHAEQMTNLANKFHLKCKRFQLDKIKYEMFTAPHFCLPHILFGVRAVKGQYPPHAYAALLDQQVNY